MTTLISLLVAVVLSPEPSTYPVFDMHPPPPPTPEQVHVHRWSVDWDALAGCESNHRWDYNGPGIYDGGLQHHPRTWTTYKPDGFPEEAWQATPDQQKQVAERVLADQGLEAWPACTLKLGWR